MLMKKKNQYLANSIYDQNFSDLQKIYLLYNKIYTLLPLNNMLRKCYKNFQRGITLQIFGAL